MQRVKQELENISLQYLDPIGYAEISRYIETKYGDNKEFIDHIRSLVNAKLKENSIDFSLEGRIKTVYSIYRKMYTQNKSFDEIYDFYALRIIVGTELECYTTLGLIHEMFKSIPGRFKDYISTPKPNMYRSLHTTVIGRDGIPFEVQIRTREMHEVAEYGIAAHWKYKSGEKADPDIDRKLDWIARLIETEDATRDPDEFMAAIKTDVFHDETYVFTPKGDVIALPYGATVIDFAYAIHSAVGNKMVGAKINGMIVPIDRVPQNGEIVEIITSSSSRGPSRDWLNIVRTSEARTKIRTWFKKEKRADNIQLGRSLVEQLFRGFGCSYTDAQFDQICDTVAQRNGFNGTDDLFNTIGYGGISMTKISSRLRDEFDRTVRPADTQQTEHEFRPVRNPGKIRTNSGVVVDGESGCAVKFAKCCSPLPGDRIVGFITQGFGISIHKEDCPNVKKYSESPEKAARLVSAEWEGTISSRNGDVFESSIRVVAENRLSLMADLTAALYEMRVSVLNFNSQNRPDGTTIVSFKVACKNTEHFYSIVSRLKSIRYVKSVDRGFI
ncbi:MAG: bifunctional (p)ppGpp synthetase/guanosine-3',5'-bis(diphosphate) 3'-pyrophosphohydrolase, partial [Clostridia bacterium]|nr:bifunctional (p)ppGpp synthetase/guanosine-3',5'-bis(diphosphate) 3'-pyrophosphohydrolase [Clostridia bacterium]